MDSGQQNASSKKTAEILPGLYMAVLDLCFPPACLGCKARIRHSAPPLFCPVCRRQVRLLNRPLCTRCGKPFLDGAGGDHLCGICLKKSRHFSMARAVALYEGPMAEAIHAFKYHGKTTGLSSFASLKNQAGATADLFLPDLIMPVPLHVAKLRQRGFNQALLLARAFFPEQRRKIMTGGLQRRKLTAPQTGMSGRERRLNVKNAFAVRDADSIRHKKILLIDDVFTTGSTVDECAKALLRSGAREVQVLTLARVKE